LAVKDDAKRKDSDRYAQPRYSNSLWFDNSKHFDAILFDIS
jgi:hypothetical protein